MPGVKMIPRTLSCTTHQMVVPDSKDDVIETNVPILDLVGADINSFEKTEFEKPVR